MHTLSGHRGTYIWGGVCTFGALQLTANFGKKWRRTYFRRRTNLRGFTVVNYEDGERIVKHHTAQSPFWPKTRSPDVWFPPDSATGIVFEMMPFALPLMTAPLAGSLATAEKRTHLEMQGDHLEHTHTHTHACTHTHTHTHTHARTHTHTHTHVRAFAHNKHTTTLKNTDNRSQILVQKKKNRNRTTNWRRGKKSTASEMLKPVGLHHYVLRQANHHVHACRMHKAWQLQVFEHTQAIIVQ